MNLESPLVNVPKSVDEIKQFLANYSNFKQIFPKEVNHFEVHENGFTFGLGALPKVGLKRSTPMHDKQIALESTGGPVTFKLLCNMREVDDQNTECQICFEGDVNPMLRMMLEKPLQNLLNHLADGLRKS